MIDIVYLDKNTVKKGDIKNLSRLKNKKIWVDCTDISEKEVKLLKEAFDLHDVTIEDMHLSHGRVKVEQFSNYLFSTFYTIRREHKKVRLHPIEFCLGKNFIISAHKKEIENYEKIKKDSIKLKHLFKHKAELIFHRLLDEEIDEFFPILETLDDEIEEIDKRITDSSAKELLSEILEVKKRIVEIKKITLPQREKISFLTKKRCRFISDNSYPYFRDVYDQSIRVADVVENFRESISSSFDTYMTNVANNTNDIMKVLSIIATIALPLTVVSGIYGTNFVKIPGLNAETAFFNMMLVMGIMALGMLLYFRKKKWF